MSMHICADLDKLQSHQDFLEQEISLGGRITERLVMQAQQNILVPHIAEDVLRQQILFADELMERLKHRKQLLMEMHELLTHAKTQMVSDTSDALYRIRPE